MFLKKLTIANLTTRKVRVALTVAAIALSVSLVVSVTGGYTSIEQTAFAYLVRYMGSHDGQITRSNDLRGTIDESVADEIAKDPDVTNVEARLENFGSILTAEGTPLWPAHVVGARRPEDRRVESMEVVEGAWFNSSDSNDGVIDQVGARMLHPSWVARGGATTQHV